MTGERERKSAITGTTPTQALKEPVCFATEKQDTRVAPSNQSNAMVDWFMIHSCRCARLDCIHERGWSVEKKQSVYSTVYTNPLK